MDTQRFVALQPQLSVSVPPYLVLSVPNLPQKSRSSRLGGGSTEDPFSVSRMSTYSTHPKSFLHKAMLYVEGLCMVA